jgi:pyruvate dehydrogenase E2 component (dihydrolipoamide acetyltransferase)
MIRSDYRARNPSWCWILISDVLMPQMGLEVIEATVIDVLVAIGQEVAEGVGLMEIETDKATTEIVAPRTGFIATIDVTIGQLVPVGARLATIGDRIEESAALPARHHVEVASVVAHAATRSDTKLVPDVDPVRQRVAPVARRAAEELGLPLGEINGTGPRGRVTLRDVEAAAAEVAAAVSPVAASGNGMPRSRAADRLSRDGEIEPLSRSRRAIARRMTASQLIPQYQLQRDIDATHMLAQKEAQAAVPGSVRPGINELLMQAIAETVVRHPALAMTFVEEPEPGLRRHADIGIGLAVATERGLLVPVLRAVHRTGLHDLAAQRQGAVDAARAGRLTLEQMSGAAVTLSNLGSFGVDRFTAMLNPGESTIVAVGRVTDRVVPRGRGITVIPVLTVTMTFDHRAIDGAIGGAAIAELAELLEGAMTWRP